MLKEFQIDYNRKIISVEKDNFTFDISKFNKTTEIENISRRFHINCLKHIIGIEKNYTIQNQIIRQAYYTDWTILQDEYLPKSGMYCLN